MFRNTYSMVFVSIPLRDRAVILLSISKLVKRIPVRAVLNIGCDKRSRCIDTVLQDPGYLFTLQYGSGRSSSRSVRSVLALKVSQADCCLRA